MKVIALPEVRAYLKELIYILYEKEYFGFEESAQKYVEDLFSDIETHLPAKVKKPAPSYFDKYGKKMLYSSFRKNEVIPWDVFFNIYQKTMK